MTTNPWPKQNTADLISFYGNPNNTSVPGTVSPVWQTQNLTYITPPYPMFLAWDKGKQVHNISIHRKCADSLLRVLSNVGKYYTPEQIKALHLDLYGGAFGFRLMRGGHLLSMHSYGAAIDIDPEHNQFGSHNIAMPQTVVDIFGEEGWTWGGHWSKPDAMHFQAANI